MDNTSQVIVYSALYLGLMMFGLTDNLYASASSAVVHGLIWTTFRLIHHEVNNP